MEEIRFKEVMAKSWAIYKVHWTALVLISFLSLLVTHGMNLMQIYRGSHESTAAYALVSLGLLFVTVISIYLNARLSITLYSVSESAMKAEDVRFARHFSNGRPYVWSYIGLTILIGVMLLIPETIVANAVANKLLIRMPYWGQFIVIPTFMGITIYLKVILYFVLALVVLRPNTKNLFTYSKRLVSRNYKTIFLLVLIPYVWRILGNLWYYVVSQDGVSALMQYVPRMIFSLPGIWIGPFFILCIVVSLELIEKGEEPEMTFGESHI